MLAEPPKNSNLQKEILSPGVPGLVPDFPDGSKVLFHFQTHKCDQTVIDDTRKMGRPMEFVLGKKFKLEVWEACVKTMRVKEVARFTIDKSYLASYPWVSKMVRASFGKDPKKPHKNDAVQPKSHCCGMMALSKEGLGHQDLDELVQTPQDLIFTMELLQVIHPGEYEKETWEMNDEEKLVSLPKLREEGNRLYANKQYTEASQKYAEALGRLEQLSLKEKPGDEESQNLEKMKIPFLMNYAQCKLLEGDFYTVIEHTSTVLDKEPDNVKALYRRAQAHVGAWNPDQAKRDYERAKSLDPSLATLIAKDLKSLEDKVRLKDQDDKAKLLGKLF